MEPQSPKPNKPKDHGKPLEWRFPGKPWTDVSMTQEEKPPKKGLRWLMEGLVLAVIGYIVTALANLVLAGM